MKPLRVSIAVALLCGMPLLRGTPLEGVAAVPTHELHARIVAVGLQSVHGVRQVGLFHAGGPIPGNPEFLMRTRAGKVLDPERLLVASASNFGAPLGNSAHAAGALLSIDPRAARTLVVPRELAQSHRQAQADAGAIQLYSVQGATFANSAYNRGAATAGFAGVSSPRYVSINNAFGRPWVANSPFGEGGAGTSTVLDPDGRPLDNAPSERAGGVFAGDLTQRAQVPIAEGVASSVAARALNYRPSGQLTAGDLSSGALGTAFLGPSPDGSNFAVFAVATANGALAQVHVQDGVDGLAPPGTFTPHTGDDAGVVGVAFKWNAERVLYVADRGASVIAALHLDDDRRHFRIARVSHLRAPQLREPSDIAPAVPELANPRFASHTTLAGGSDLYVANRGDGSLLRIAQDGRVLARAVLVVPGLGVLGARRLRGMAVSADAQRVWLTVQGEVPSHAGHAGVLIEVSGFDAGGPFARALPHRAEAQRSGVDVAARGGATGGAARAGATGGAARAGAADALAQAVADAATGRPDAALAAQGEQAFTREFGVADGLGPLFNARSCAACHGEPSTGGMSTEERRFALRAARLHPTTGRLETLADGHGALARRHSTRELGVASAPPAGLPRDANATSLRMPPPLYDTALIERIDEASILAHAVGKGDGIRGRPNRVRGADGVMRIGRYGWKADTAHLDEMVAQAYANELGIGSPLARDGDAPPDDDGTLVRAVVAFLRGLTTPARGR